MTGSTIPEWISSKHPLHLPAPLLTLQSLTLTIVSYLHRPTSRFPFHPLRATTQTSDRPNVQRACRRLDAHGSWNRRRIVGWDRRSSFWSTTTHFGNNGKPGRGKAIGKGGVVIDRSIDNIFLVHRDQPCIVLFRSFRPSLIGRYAPFWSDQTTPFLDRSQIRGDGQGGRRVE